MTSETSLPKISDYAVIGDRYSCALVSTRGSIDWACFPKFASPSIFGRLLDPIQGGFFQIAPEDLSEWNVSRSYLEQTNILQTRFENNDGSIIELIDFMPIFGIQRERICNHIIRVVRCLRGQAPMQMILEPRFNYGRSQIEGWRRDGDEFDGVFSSSVATASLSSDITLPPEALGDRIESEFLLEEGETRRFVMSYSPSAILSQPKIKAENAEELLESTRRYWESWSSQVHYQGKYREHVTRSSLVLSLLTYEPTGAVIAAPTTSIPETLGGVRNWDYRYAWLRDSTLTVHALYMAGHSESARRFQDWLCESANTCMGDIQVMYGVEGEVELKEEVLAHWTGYQRSRPVRIGNAAAHQFQLDIYGELMSCLWHCLKHGDNRITPRWEGIKTLLQFVCDHWREPDSGIWEVRSEPQHFVHSKAMAWVALDRGIRAAALLGLEGDIELWKEVASEIHAEVLSQGWNEEKQSFVQSYGSQVLDAANLRLSLVGFIPADHPKMIATIDATLRELTVNGLIYRYRYAEDGLSGEEGTFAICSCWMIQSLIALGRVAEARALLEKLLSFTNDVQLLAEQIDPMTGEQLGNFPQGFSHLGILASILDLARLSSSPETEASRRTHAA